MPIPLDDALKLLKHLSTHQIENLFAQTRAKHVLLEVKEAPENFPPFDPQLEDKVTVAAYALLSAGCSMAESGQRPHGAEVLERAASLLQSTHGPLAEYSPESGFHILVASMAFYAAGHYSKAFVTVRSVEGKTSAGRIIAAFLKKDIHHLISRLNEVLLTDTVKFDDPSDLIEWAITVAIARASALALEFSFSGKEKLLDQADKLLGNTTLLASLDGRAGWWAVARLLQLMLRDLHEASPWEVLPPFFDPPDADAVRQYCQLLAFAKHPMIEFWPSQRAALPLALNLQNKGGVINLRTSAGKTKVAELAILQTLLARPGARVFYLAPFRSLALEVEQTLASTMSYLGYEVSHLYGGSRVSSIDTELASESTITIATPEKAKALFRAAPELLDNVGLFIIDEGHLIGPEERLVRNEVFVDHLRVLVRKTGARILLLSAVLPNAEQLAEWITGDNTALIKSKWKPASERFGTLRWNGKRARIDWIGAYDSFNPSFVEAKQLMHGARSKFFPNSKNQAVAAAAARLCAIGPVMIFVGRAVSVPTMAESVLLALGEQPDEFPWPDHEWRLFAAVAEEELEPDAMELQAARLGVICHSSRLTPQVRNAIERLMRSKSPRIIIATSTLAQGVNIGISSVIVASPYIGKERIDKRDFWNICGRAGRAFVDGEGKVLYAIDQTREKWQVEKDEALALSYFDVDAPDKVESGLLYIIKLLHYFAAEAGIAFEHLLELAANNDFESLGDKAEDFSDICDLVDDELLALHIDPSVNPADGDPTVWIEQVFRNSLAEIQARAGASEIGPEDVLGFLQARAHSTLLRVPTADARRVVASSGLPLSTAIRISQNLHVFRVVGDAFISDEENPNVLADGLRATEEWARVHAHGIIRKMPTPEKLEPLRSPWLEGVALRTLSKIDGDAPDICRNLFGYQLPWIIHAASQALRRLVETERADALAKLALLVELGLPSHKAAKIFLAGIRSRTSAAELASLSVDFGTSISEIRRNFQIKDFIAFLVPRVSSSTGAWLGLLLVDAAQGKNMLHRIPDFRLTVPSSCRLLHVRKMNSRLFLCTADGKVRIAVRSTTDLPFEQIADDPRVVFERYDSCWRMAIRDPHVHESDYGE